MAPQPRRAPKGITSSVTILSSGRDPALPRGPLGFHHRAVFGHQGRTSQCFPPASHPDRVPLAPPASTAQHSTAPRSCSQQQRSALWLNLVNFQPFKVMNGYRFPSFVHRFSAIRLESCPAEPQAEPRADSLPCSPTAAHESHPARLMEPQVNFYEILPLLTQCPPASVSLLGWEGRRRGKLCSYFPFENVPRSSADLMLGKDKPPSLTSALQKRPWHLIVTVPQSAGEREQGSCALHKEVFRQDDYMLFLFRLLKMPYCHSNDRQGAESKDHRGERLKSPSPPSV